MATDFNNSKDLWSTGNRLKDYGIGAAVGLSNLVNRPGQYYVKANYKGRGLADTGLGYIQNQSYQNPYDQAALLASILSGGNEQESLQDKLGIQLNQSGVDFKRPFNDYNNITNLNYSLPYKDYNYNTDWLYNTPRQYSNNDLYSLGNGYNIPQGLSFLNR